MVFASLPHAIECVPQVLVDHFGGLRVADAAAHLVVLGDRDAGLAELVRDLTARVSRRVEEGRYGLTKHVRREPGKCVISSGVSDVTTYVRRVPEAAEAVREHRLAELSARHEPATQHGDNGWRQAKPAFTSRALGRLTDQALTPDADDRVG